MTYGITGDIDGNGWWAGVNDDIMVYSDANDQVHEIKLPPQPATEYLKPGDFAEGEVIPQLGIGGKQSPRRPFADLKGTAVWVPNFYGNTLLRIDSQDEGAEVLPGAVSGDDPVRSGSGQPAQRLDHVPELRRDGTLQPADRQLDDVQLSVERHGAAPEPHARA